MALYSPKPYDMIHETTILGGFCCNGSKHCGHGTPLHKTWIHFVLLTYLGYPHSPNRPFSYKHFHNHKTKMHLGRFTDGISKQSLLIRT